MAQLAVPCKSPLKVGATITFDEEIPALAVIGASEVTVELTSKTIVPSIVNPVSANNVESPNFNGVPDGKYEAVDDNEEVILYEPESLAGRTYPAFRFDAF